MISHEQAEILAATAIDFPLAADEAAELAAHRRTCTVCRDVEAQLRGDAAALRDMELVDAPFAVREAVEAALARPQAIGQRRLNRPMLVLIAATLLMALAAGGIIAGSLLNDDDDIVVVERSPSPTASGTPRPVEPTSTASASASPTPSAEGGQTPSTTARPAVQLTSGRWARLLEPLNLRTEPSVGASVVNNLNRGRLAYIFGDAPVASGGYTWYRVLTSRDEVGWMAGASQGRALLYQDGVDATVLFCATPSQRAFLDTGNDPFVRSDSLVLGNLRLPSTLFSLEGLAAADLAYGDGSAEVCATMPIADGWATSATMRANFRTCGIPDAGAVEWYLRYPDPAAPSGMRRGGIHDVVFGYSTPIEDEGHGRLLLLAGADAEAPTDRIVCVAISLSGGLDDSLLQATFSADVCVEVVSVDEAAVVVRGVAPWSGEEYRFERHPGSTVDDAITAGSTQGITIELPGGTLAPVSMRPASVAGCGVGA